MKYCIIAVSKAGDGEKGLRPSKKIIETQEVLLDHQPLNYIVRLRNLILSQKQNLHKLSVLLIVNLIAAGLGFVTKIKIANTLSKADFGLVAYAFAIASYSAAIIYFGSDRTLVRDLIHFPERQGRLIASSLLLRGILFFVVTIALLVWKYCSPRISDLTWGVVLIAIGQYMVGLELKPVYDSWGKMNRHAVYNLIQRCTYLLAIWLMIILAPKRFSILWIGIFSVPTYALCLLQQGSWAFKRIDFSGINKYIFNDTLVMARENLIIWFSCIGALFIAVFNQLILKFYAGLDSLGNYAAGWQLVSVATIFLTQIARIGNPATARITKSGISTRAKVKFLIKYSAVMLLAVSPLSLVTIIWPEFILRLIYKPEYASATETLRIMGIYMAMFSLGLVASQYVISLRKDKSYFVSIILGGVISVVFCFALIPKMKEVGAILSLLISHTFSMLIYFAVIISDLCKKEGQSC